MKKDQPLRISAAMCGRGRVLSEPRLSPEGTRVAFVATSAGSGALVVVPAAGGAELTLTSDPPVKPAASYGGGLFDWLPSGDGLVYVASDGTLQVQAVDGGPPRPVRDVGGSASAPAVSPDGTRVAYSSDAAHIVVSSLDPQGSWPIRVSADADFCLDPTWSSDGTAIAWHEWDVPSMPWDESRIMVAQVGGSPRSVGASGAAPGAAVAMGQPRFSSTGVLGFVCDGRGWMNLWRCDTEGAGVPVLEERIEHAGPTWGPGQRSWAWSPDGRRIAFCSNEAGFGRLCVVEVADGRTTEVDRGVFLGVSWVGDKIAALRTGARSPDQVVVYEAPADAAAVHPEPARLVLARGPVAGFEVAEMVEPELVSWTGESTAAGTEVYGRLYRAARRPEGSDPEEPGPLIVWVHGGPTGQDQVTFGARSAYFLERGWSILRVDHRGSTGWGRSYTQALRERWGRLDVADVVAGMTAGIQAGWASSGSIVLMGGSAGGFTVLNVMAAAAELCAAGVDLYGVTDLFDLAETTHRFEAHYLDSLVGPLPAAAGEYRARSPINNVDRITSPLLVLQGSADQVVPQAQSDALVAALRQRGCIVDYHVYDGEGHGWSRAEVVEDELGRIDAFLTRHVLRRRA